MRKTTDITFGVSGQTVEYRVPQGRPTSATFSVFNDYAADDDTAEFSGTATVESVNQSALSGASGPSQTDPNRINVVSTNVTTARKYLVAEGQRQEWVSPVEVGSGYVRARHPLKNDYTTAATFVGSTITAAIDNTWAGSEENLSEHSDPNPSYRVRWAIVVGSETFIAYSYFDLVRAPVLHQIDIDDINGRAPGLMATMPTEYRVEQGRPLLEAAWRAVKADLAVCRLDVDAFRNDEALDELMIMKSLYVLAIGGWKPQAFPSVSEYLAEVRRDYDRYLEQHVKVNTPYKMATDTTGSASPIVSTPFFAK